MIDKIKSEIILKDGLFYFDWTASGLGHKSVEDEIARVLQTYANTHSECKGSARITSEKYERAKAGIKRFLGLGDDFYLIACGYGATAAIKKFSEIMGIYAPPATMKRVGAQSGDGVAAAALPLVIIGPFEHHSNDLCWRYGFCEPKRLSLAKDGGPNWGDLDRLLRIWGAKREIIISISAASNVTGVKTDLNMVRKMADRYGAVVAVDAAALIAHENIDSGLFDALFISPHKLLGGVGSCGLLAVKKSLIAKVATELPTFAAGGTVSYVNKNSAFFLDDFERLEEAGTQPVTQMIRAYLAFEMRAKTLDVASSIEMELLRQFEDGLKKIKNAVLYAPDGAKRVATSAFNLKGVSPYELAGVLSEHFGVQVRAGCACAGPYGHELLNLGEVWRGAKYFESEVATEINKPGWVRASFHYTHSKSDVEYLLGAIKSASKMKFNRYEP